MFSSSFCRSPILRPAVLLNIWADHYGAPRAQLQAEMASEVLSFARNVVGRHLRFSETKDKLVLEWRIGDDWCQCVPFAAG